MTNHDNGAGDNQNLSPRSVEGEEATLGSILINPDIFIIIIAFLKPDDFFVLRNAWVFEAMLTLHNRGEAIDNLTVVNELRLAKRLDDIGGAAYITFLINNTPTHIHGETYGRIVERASIRRKLLNSATKIGQLALDENREIDEIKSAAEQELFAVTSANSSRRLVPLSEIASDYYDHLEYQVQNPDAPLGIPTGYVDLDKLTGGLQRSDLIIVAGRPGMGKTSFLLSICRTAARLGKARIAIYSMEMNKDQLMQRMLAAETAIDSQKLRLGALDGQQFARAGESLARMGNMEIYVDDRPGLTIRELRSSARRGYRELGIDMIVIDYLQLMHSGDKIDNRVIEVGLISTALKELARELNIPIVCAAQLSRAVEQRQDKRPQLSDLRESGSIENDADIVMFIYRDDMYNESSDRPNQADIIVTKHRNGPTGVVTLFFRKELTEFTNMTSAKVNLSEF